MKTCGNPKVYIAVGLGVVLLVLTVYITIRLAEYLVKQDGGECGGGECGDDKPLSNKSGTENNSSENKMPVGSLL